MSRFVRFRSRLRHADLSMPLGLFHAASKLIEAEQMDPWASQRSEEICDWFDQYLPVLQLKSGSSRAVFWFRSERCDMIQRLWELAILLQEHGAFIELVCTTRPGWVRYEDEYQVAAVPTRR